MRVKLLAVAGSVRHEFFIARRWLTQWPAREAGAEVTLLEPKDFSLALFDEDREGLNGVPENAARLKQLFIENQGLLIACPEYNSSITALLKNILDWVSRPRQGQSGLIPYQDKIAALVSASSGSLGVYGACNMCVKS